MLWAVDPFYSFDKPEGEAHLRDTTPPQEKSQCTGFSHRSV